MPTRTAAAEVPPERLQRPRLAACVVLHPPADGNGSWIIQRGESRYFRISADVARLAGEFDGRRDHAQLARTLGAPWRTADVGTVVSRLAATGMLDDGTPFSRRRTSRWRIAPPLTVQFSVLHPGRALAFCRPLVAAAMSRPAKVGFAALVVVGLACLLVRAADLRAALTSPLPLSLYLWVFLGVLATTAVHEVAHGAVLTYHGGRPSRLGIMLFYLSPAFFCDVSDGWRLADRNDRVRIALAGVVIQFGIAGAAAVVAVPVGWVWPGSVAPQGLLLFAVATFLAGLVNLVPFIKLDGYIALMSHVDVPHLRRRSMVDGRRALARFLFGGRYRRELPDRPWAPWFGLGCMVFPVYVIAGALAVWAGLLSGLGPLGLGLAAVILAAVGYYVGRGAVRLVREGRAAGAPSWRMVLVAAGALGLVGWALIGLRLPVTVDGGYVLADDGTAALVSTTGIDPRALRPGAPVTLYRAGLGGREAVGAAELASTEDQDGTAPLTALVPVDDLPVQVPAHRLPLRIITAPPDPVGAARLQGPTLPLWEWLAVTYVHPVVNW